MAKKKKVILISAASNMYKTKEDVLASEDPINWHAKVAVQIHRRSDKYLLEVWCIESFVKTPFSFIRDGLKYRFFPCKGPVDFRTISPKLIESLGEESKKNEILIHFHTYQSWLGYSVFRTFPNLPILVQHHGDTRPLLLLVRQPKYFWTLPVLLAEELCEYLYFKNIDKFFVISPIERDNIARRFGTDKVEMLSMGVDFDVFKPLSKKIAREKFGLPQNKKIMLFIGPYRPYEKGCKLIVDAYNDIKKKRGNVELVCAGGKSDNESYAFVKNNVKYEFGRIPNKKTVYLHNAADAYILFSDKKSIKYGGFGVAPAESLACGTPIVSTNLFNMQDKDSAKCGRQFWTKKEFIPSILHVLDHPEKYKNCREIARRHFDWTVIVKRTIDVYDELFKKYYG